MNELGFVKWQFSQLLLDSLVEQALDAAREEEWEESEEDLEPEEDEA